MEMQSFIPVLIHLKSRFLPRLKWDEIAFFLNSSPKGHRYFGENFNRNYYESRVQPAMRTWASAFKYVWVVMEDAPAARALTSDPKCRVERFASSKPVPETNTNTDTNIDTKSDTTSPAAHTRQLLRVAEVLDKGEGKKLDRFCSGCIRGGSDETLDYTLEYFCDSHPIILSNCSNGYWGTDGPCCKCEAAFRHLVQVRPEVHQKIRWMVFSDDDMYFVPPTMVNFLSAHDPFRPIVVSRGEIPVPLNYGKYWEGRKNPGGINCKSRHLRTSMLQPAIFSPDQRPMLNFTSSMHASSYLLQRSRRIVSSS